MATEYRVVYNDGFPPTPCADLREAAAVTIECGGVIQKRKIGDWQDA